MSLLGGEYFLSSSSKAESVSWWYNRDLLSFFGNTFNTLGFFYDIFCLLRLSSSCYFSIFERLEFHMTHERDMNDLQWSSISSVLLILQYFTCYPRPILSPSVSYQQYFWIDMSNYVGCWPMIEWLVCTSCARDVGLNPASYVYPIG